jgi:hypothetical protein
LRHAGRIGDVVRLAHEGIDGAHRTPAIVIEQPKRPVKIPGLSSGELATELITDFK